jgi:hypothetical protein
MHPAAPLMVAGFVVASLGCASAQVAPPTHVIEAEELLCVSWEQLAHGPAGIFLQNAAIQIVEDKRPVDFLIVEDQRIESGAPVVTFRAERQDRRLTFVWNGGPLVDRPDSEHHADMMCGTIDSIPISADGSADSERMFRQIYMPPLDREARYLLGYKSSGEGFSLLQVKGEGVDWLRKLPVTPTDSPSIQMFGDASASQQ